MQRTTTKNIFVITLNQFDHENELRFFSKEDTYTHPVGTKNIFDAGIFDTRIHADRALLILDAPSPKVLLAELVRTVSCSLVQNHKVK